MIDTPTADDVQDLSEIDTRDPHDTQHEENFADVVGEKPVVLTFATPLLCQSRVCGPVVDVSEQVKSEYGDDVAFIHQEIFEDNDINKGLRDQVEQFGLPTEPWVYVIDADGNISSALEGAYGVTELEDAVEKVAPSSRTCRSGSARWRSAASSAGTRARGRCRPRAPAASRPSARAHGDHPLVLGEALLVRGDLALRQRDRVGAEEQLEQSGVAQLPAAGRRQLVAPGGELALAGARDPVDPAAPARLLALLRQEAGLGQPPAFGVELGVWEGPQVVDAALGGALQVIRRRRLEPLDQAEDHVRGLSESRHRHGAEE